MLTRHDGIVSGPGSNQPHPTWMHYEDYYELSEKHGWRATDLDWQGLLGDRDAGRITDFDLEALLGTAVIEQGVPHYGEVWTLVPKLRDHWELWQFATLWTGEEHRHSFVLKKACDVLGITEQIAEDLEKVRRFPFAVTQKESCPTDCYRSVPGMLAYTVIQELATNKFYTLASKRTRSPFLKRMFHLIASDEMRHHVFYREALGELYEASTDKLWYSDQVYQAAVAFRMPHLIYDVQTPFFEQGDWSIGVLGKVAFKAQLMRCFAFDARLVGRLVTDRAAAELERSGGRMPAPRAPASDSGGFKETLGLS